MSWGDGSLWGDGGLYVSDEGVAHEFVTERELHYHRISTRVNYTASLIPGAPEAFRIYDIRLRVAPDRQGSFTHESFVDAVTNSERISLKLTHTGSEFIVSHMQIIATRKRHQPKG